MQCRNLLECTALLWTCSSLPKYPLFSRSLLCAEAWPLSDHTYSAASNGLGRSWIVHSWHPAETWPLADSVYNRVGKAHWKCFHWGITSVLALDNLPEEPLWQSKGRRLNLTAGSKKVTRTAVPIPLTCLPGLSDEVGDCSWQRRMANLKQVFLEQINDLCTNPSEKRLIRHGTQVQL